MRLRPMRLLGTVFLSLLLLGVAVAPPEIHAQTATLSCTLQSSTSSTGTGTACPVGGYNVLTMQVTGTPGAVYFQGSLDGTNYVSLLCMESVSLSYSILATTRGVYHCSVKNFAFARANITVAGTNVAVVGVGSTLTWATGAF